MVFTKMSLKLLTAFFVSLLTVNLLVSLLVLAVKVVIR